MNKQPLDVYDLGLAPSSVTVANCHTQISSIYLKGAFLHFAWLGYRHVQLFFPSRCLRSNQIGSIMFRSLRAYMDMVVEKGIRTTESTKQWKIREQSYPVAFPEILIGY